VNKTYGLIGILLILILSTCKHNIPLPYFPLPADSIVCFRGDIYPIINSSCAKSGCHDGSESPDLKTYDDIIKIVNTNNPGKSKILRLITKTSGERKMPPDKDLTPDQINLIYWWIEQGAKDTQCDDLLGCDSTNVSFTQSIFPIINTYCAGCHLASSGNGTILTDYNNILNSVNSGKFLGSIEHNSGYSPMPKNGTKLSECKIAKIKNWINAGAPNN
jgi:hypothetical protein